MAGFCRYPDHTIFVQHVPLAEAVNGGSGSLNNKEVGGGGHHGRSFSVAADHQDLIKKRRSLKGLRNPSIDIGSILASDGGKNAHIPTSIFIIFIIPPSFSEFDPPPSIFFKIY